MFLKVTIVNMQLIKVNAVIYWPLTEPSIKRRTCVNKWKNSGSRWVLNNNITRCPDGSSQLETRCQSENQRRLRALQSSMTHGWTTQPKWERSVAMVRRTWVNIAVCPCLQLISHTQQTSPLLRIKCERYIFIKKCVCLFIEVRKSMLWSYLPNPSARAGYETRSIFKRSLTGLNSEFSFS